MPSPPPKKQVLKLFCVKRLFYYPPPCTRLECKVLQDRIHSASHSTGELLGSFLVVDVCHLCSVVPSTEGIDKSLRASVLIAKSHPDDVKRQNVHRGVFRSRHLWVPNFRFSVLWWWIARRLEASERLAIPAQVSASIPSAGSRQSLM